MAWASLGGYLRGLTLIALFDAVGIGLALLVLDVPIAARDDPLRDAPRADELAFGMRMRRLPA